MKSYLTLSVAILASVGTFAGPLALADHLGSWWYLAGCLLMIPACQACWRAYDRSGSAG